MTDPKIYLHHVGGRDGEVGGFPINPRFRNDFEVHVYECDDSCTPLNEAFRPVKTIKGVATTMDRCAEQLHVPVDVLSIDTQGTEDEVIAGAHTQLLRHTVTVVCEVSFRELYEGQPLFHDIKAALERLGFTFIRFLNPQRQDTSEYRFPIGWRGQEGALCFDALFFRRPEHADKHTQDPARSLSKLALVALSFGHIEYALECLKRVSNRGPITTGQAPEYLEFLNKLWNLYCDEDSVWMAKFSELFSEEESFARFDENILHHWNIYKIDERFATAYLSCSGKSKPCLKHCSANMASSNSPRPFKPGVAEMPNALLACFTCSITKSQSPL